MSRVVRGAQVLEREVKALRPEAAVEVGSEVDGLDVRRTLIFDRETSEWLVPLLEQLRDKRIEDWSGSEDGRLSVTFTGKTMADIRDPFNLASAEVVVAASRVEDPPADPPEQILTPVEKPPAKKTAKKTAK